MSAHSVRLSFRLGKSGDQDIEAISNGDCRIQVNAEPGNNGEIIVEAVIVWGEPIDGQGQTDCAVPDTGTSEAVNVRHRHVVRVGKGDFGPVRVLGHEVSPYDWRLVNFGASGAYHLNELDLSKYNQTAGRSFLNALPEGEQ